MSTVDPQVQPIPGNTPEARIAALEKQVAVLLSIGDGFDVGDWKYTSAVPQDFLNGGLILIGKWAVPNAFLAASADFPDLDALYAAAGYPFNAAAVAAGLPAASAGQFYFPDALSRYMVGIGTHADANSLGDCEGVYTLANRAQKHNSTNGLSLSGISLSGSPTLSGSPSVSDPGHAHSYSEPFVSGPGPPSGYAGSGMGSVSTGSSTTGVTVGAGTLSVAKGSLSVSGGSLSGTIGPGGTTPVDTGSYLCGGIHLLRVLP